MQKSLLFNAASGHFHLSSLNGQVTIDLVCDSCTMWLICIEIYILQRLLLPVVTFPWTVLAHQVTTLWCSSAGSLNHPLEFCNTGSVPNGYPNPTRYPVSSSIPDPTRFNFENHGVAGNPKYRVLPEISGNTRSFGYYPKFWVSPEVSGNTWYFGLQIIRELPGIPGIPGITRK